MGRTRTPPAGGKDRHYPHLLVDLNPEWDSLLDVRVRVWSMRTGISLAASRSDRRRLRAVVEDRNSPQKHVWRADRRVTERVVALTLTDPPGETTHWTGAMMAKAS